MNLITNQQSIALLNRNILIYVVLDEDIGGMPLTGDSTGKNIKAAAFVPSRWETVDPHEAEEQAMTTSKWEMLERENKNYNSESIDQDSQDDDLNETRYFYF